MIKERVLLSAYACFDGFGSEPGVGYNWLEQLAKTEHYDITLCTSGWSMAKLKNDPMLESIDVIEIGSCKWDQIFRKNRFLFQLYLYVWQLHLFLYLFFKKQQYDIVHHITFGGVTIPSFIFLFGKKSYYGPVGGAEKAPKKLAQSTSYKDGAKESLKRISVFFAKLDPFLLLTRKGFSKILIKNKDNSDFYSAVSSKVIVKAEICFDDSNIPPQKTAHDKNGCAIFAARGIYWKGGTIAIDIIKAYNKLHTEGLELHLYGSGNAYNDWKAKSGKDEHFIFHGRVDRNILWENLKHADFFIFPSFHDSSGNAVLESLCFGVPVLAFDLGGPSSIIEHDFMLINPNQKYDDLIQEFVSKIQIIQKLTKADRQVIAEVYRAKFTPNKLLKGVYL
jgi:glycosyltransferase involved in cell wall biosynthesis